jgi:hypothetical protein
VKQSLRDRLRFIAGVDQRVQLIQANEAGCHAPHRFRDGHESVKNRREIHRLSNAPDPRIYSGFLRNTAGSAFKTRVEPERTSRP